MQRFKKLNDSTAYVDLSSPQHSAMGSIICQMYYRTNMCETVGDLFSGYPHNGGMHTLHIKGHYKDVIASIELIRDEVHTAFHPMITEARKELTELCKQIEQAFKE